MKLLVDLSHLHVMPSVRVMSPTKGCGPILFTRHSEFGSLETVPFLSSSELAALDVNDLHKTEIMHRKLKPKDLIIESDGTLHTCGDATSIFEERKSKKNITNSQFIGYEA
jgi:hypothetical protein